jgi:hypothetical protein
MVQCRSSTRLTAKPLQHLGVIAEIFWKELQDNVTT